MIDLGMQAQEAATRSQTLAATNRVVDASRDEAVHPAVEKTLAGDQVAASADRTNAGTGRRATPGETPVAKDAAKSDEPSAASRDGGRKESARPDKPEPTPAERAERLAMLQSPARGIAAAMRMPKHTGAVRQCDHSGDVSVWHLLGHLAQSANQISRYGMNAMIAGARDKPARQEASPGILQGIHSGFVAGRTGTPAAAVAEAALAADAKAGTPAKAQARRARSGGMEL